MKNSSAQFEVGSGYDAVAAEVPDDLTLEHASRLAVLAVAADLEYWARAAASKDGYIGLNDLTRTLDIIREAMRSGCDADSRGARRARGWRS